MPLLFPSKKMLLMSLLIAAFVAVAAVIVFVAYKLVKASIKKTTVLQFAGQVAVAVDEIGLGKEGFVLFQGEHWKAESKSSIASGEKVRIISREGLTLVVEPIKEFS